MADHELPPVPDYRLREPTFGLPRSGGPRLLPDTPRFQVDPSLMVNPAAPFMLPSPSAATGAFPHLLDPSPAATATPNPLAGLLHAEDGSIGVQGSGHVGPLDLQGHAGVNPNSGELSAQGQATIPLIPGLNAGVQGGISGTPGSGEAPGVSGGLIFEGQF